MGLAEGEDSPEKLALFKRYSEPISDSLMFKVIDFLQFRNQNVLVAPYESDPQLAFLQRTGKIEYIVSEDSDMFALGCYKIIKGLKCTGECKVLDLVNNQSKTKYENERTQAPSFHVFILRIWKKLYCNRRADKQTYYYLFIMVKLSCFW